MPTLRLVALTLVLAGANATAQIPGVTTSESARQALAMRDYEKVITIYKSASGDMSAQDHYRLAISHFKLNQPQAAHQQINLALSLNPQGTFASTQQRLDKVLADIQQSCDLLGNNGCQNEKIEAIAPTGVIPTPVIATLPEPPASSASVPTQAPVQAVPEEAVTLTPADQAPSTESTDNVLLPNHWFLIALAEASILLLGVMAWGWHRFKKAKNYSPLNNLHHAVVEQLHLSTVDTKIHVQLDALLPLIEQEVGRAYYAKNDDAVKLNETDRAHLLLAQKFEKVPMSISNASPEEIQALFQSRRWAQ